MLVHLNFTSTELDELLQRGRHETGSKEKSPNYKNRTRVVLTRDEKLITEVERECAVFVAHLVHRPDHVVPAVLLGWVLKEDVGLLDP